MPGGYGEHPEPDHAGDGQEEVYLALEGSGWIDIAGERVELEKDVFVRVGTGVKRKVHSGASGLQMLVIGGCPGKAYEIPAMTELESVA
jgi:mannose-6-phosphate isomerase-like protein (cupin superfamily)